MCQSKLVPHGVVNSYVLDSFLVQLSVGVIVVPVGVVIVLVVGVGRMTLIDRTKNANEFASPTIEVFESRKAMRIGNEMSSPTVPRAISSTMMAYILSIKSELSGKEMHRAIRSNLA
ncbi:hypothetical protein J1N35_011011 [Gossypium stocksii]|uniref:Uncharacterized protein n=1 Tax=Gossypium stocksii TaxID=47602 RepID=A0A9D3W2R5_9ROSI|nr:hypothetical protein J1N35_011011 [Gossypium stocksii]